ncbi:alkaline ceramidase ydc1 [Tilletia horrida]|uniref:Alkaline ceramidase ydc1 n=1 Tax=Tilletia horrida TaxID=155126 RepID=A0AAN6GA42_9BASI|nr:alkaline ceramidase ydc1 [Tilletia horrida]KAK0532677.1 alkaline ceramidase ydc1 [Tilletia horrida]KAK0541582.1 alkaline ceramidase ydc1 [Tilletia horrida]KAK0562703.1 alkaline ceramidase ydc1 [Tilletia horrida]
MSWYIDPEPAVGYWGPQTSTLTWCEEKYRWTKYIAEPCNSFSNLLFVGLASYGVHWARRAQLPAAFIWCYLGIGLIGIGSFLFHATALYSMQALDELPMVYTTVLFSWAVFETTPIGQKSRFRILLPAAIFLFLIFYTAAYFLNKENTLLHQLTYAILQLGSASRLFSLLSSSPQSALSKKGGKQAQVRAQVKHLFWLSTGGFALGFAIWNVDNIFCKSLRDTRARLGPVLGVLLEGHAWWHFLTGYGAYLAGLAGSFLIGAIRESPDAFEVRYKDRYGILPYLVRVQPKPQLNGHSNGLSNGNGHVLKNGKAH